MEANREARGSPAPVDMINIYMRHAGAIVQTDVIQRYVNECRDPQHRSGMYPMLGRTLRTGHQ